MLWPEAAVTFKIHEVAPYMLAADLGAVNTKTVTINKDVWSKLPDEVKTAIQKVSIEYRDRVAGVAMDEAAESIAQYKASGGTVVTLTDAERATWAAAMPNIAAEWAASLDKTGAPGTAMLKAYMDKLKAAGQKPVRDWSAN